MIKKESYKHILPHFQQPGQAYFVTWVLKDAIPPKALKRYSQKLLELKNQIQQHKNLKSEKTIIEELQHSYYLNRKKYLYAYDELLNNSKNKSVDLSEPKNTMIIIEALCYWNNRRLENYAYCIMPNHVHWVFRLFEKNEKGNPVYLQDIMQSVKRHTANQINKAENRKGNLWQKESFDTTIRDEKHLYKTINYTLNNPVAAGFVSEWQEWNGNFRCHDF